MGTGEQDGRVAVVRNRTLALTRELVPELRRRGYTLVSLDKVPQVASAARVSFQQQ
jgi:hypothetical protein